MVEVEEPQFSTLAERIAALNKQKNFQAPPSTAGKRAPPPPPPVRTATESVITTSSAQRSPAIPPRPTRAVTDDAATSATPPLPRRKTEDASLSIGNGKRGMAPPPPAPSRGAAPPLPSRNPQQKPMTPAPELPSRRPSAQTLGGRRGSSSSDASHISAMSALSLNSTSDSQGAGGRRLPPTLDQAQLPPLPPTRRETEAAKKAAEEQAIARTPVLPPRRPGQSPAAAQPEERSPALPARRLPPPPSNVPSRPSGFGFGSGRGPAPPPVPLSSRPTLEQIDKVASRGAASQTAPGPCSDPPSQEEPCLVCRDFSGPDNIAAVFPIARLPRQDVVGYLAHVLCDPFPSHTDKARAIFTWCHHNIRYDVESFFGNCVRHITAEEGIFEGKAVCGGYATIYEAIARRAGLECVMVTGHGKGYGYTPLKPGERCPPPDPTGHAWNAVKIDGGKWKLIDSCWGAGHLEGTRNYKQAFSPKEFVISNIDFGKTHFPADTRHFFREDGRILSWEEYFIGGTDGEPAKTFGVMSEEGLNEYGFTPRDMRIPVYSGKVVQFRFSKICPHWTPEKNGKGKQMLFLLKIHGVDGRKEDLLALDYDGFWFSADVQARDLGCPGQKISLFGVETMDGRDARGVSKAVWLSKKGKVGFSFTGVCEWELV